jgi:hypothetical protein
VNPVFHWPLHTVGCSQNVTDISAIVLTGCIKTPWSCFERHVVVFLWWSSRGTYCAMIVGQFVLFTFGCAMIVGQFTYTRSIKNSPKIGHRMCATLVPKFPRLCSGIKRQVLCTSALLYSIIVFIRTAAKNLLKATVRQGPSDSDFICLIKQLLSSDSV